MLLDSPLPDKTSKISYIPVSHAKLPAMLEAKMMMDLYQQTT
jgi:hypothetical protein